MAEHSQNGVPIFVDVAEPSTHYPIPATLLSQLNKPLCHEAKVDLTDVSQPNEKLQAPNDNVQTETNNTVSQPTTTVRLRCTEKKDGHDCRYTTDSEERMVQHVRKVHRGLNPFQCAMCDYSTYNKPLFEEHVRIHQGIKPFKCSYCPYRSVSKKNTRKHELVHRADNPFRCKMCPFIARHRRSLARHLLTHRGGVDCDLCEFKAQSARELKEHKLLHDPKKYVYCDKCGSKFTSKKNLNEHMKKLNQCEECKKEFCSKLLYNKHMLSVHKVSDVRADAFTCALCEWSSSNEQRVLLHLIHHPHQPVDHLPYDLTVLRNNGIIT